MDTQWNASLSVGVDEIDNQHQEIFARANRLVDAARQGGGMREIGNMLAFLDDYFIAHFSMEEDYMVRHSYPLYRPHKAEHTAFARELEGLRRQYQAEGPNLPMVIEAQHRVTDWLVKHIGSVDRGLGAFLKTEIPKHGV